MVDNMTPDEMFAVFGRFAPNEHSAEAAARWPETYEVSRQRTAGYSKAQWRQAKAATDAAAAKMGATMATGEPADGQQAMDAAEEHRLSIDRWYYPCSVSAHAGLADMYLADARFNEYWETQAEGLAQYVHDAIQANRTRSVS